MTTFRTPSTPSAHLPCQLHPRSSFASPWTLSTGQACWRVPYLANGSVSEARAVHLKKKKGCVATQARHHSHICGVISLGMSVQLCSGARSPIYHHCPLAWRGGAHLLQASSTSTLAPTAPAVPLETTRGSRAVVIGSGLAGLAASRVLADLFESVLLLERDSFEPTQVLY